MHAMRQAFLLFISAVPAILFLATRTLLVRAEDPTSCPDPPDKPASTMAAPRTAVILGATGAVGKELVHHLGQRVQWQRVLVLNRREVDYSRAGNGKVEQHVVKMEEGALEASAHQLLRDAKVDAVFITMGVGAASKASAETLEHVDVLMPTAFARGAKAAGVRHVGLLTAVGADAASDPGTGLARFVPFLPETSGGGKLYNKLKGRVEANVGALGFASATAFRPAALIGTPHTPWFIATASPLLDRVVPALYASSNINSVAAAMVFDAETRLDAHGAADGDADRAALNVVEGERLQAMYAAVPFEHGVVGGRGN